MLSNIFKDKKPNLKLNIGGPSIVALIHASQMLYDQNIEVRFFGKIGDDFNGKYLMDKLKQTPIVLDESI